MDAIDLLTADHNRVRGLFTRFREAAEADDLSRAADLVEAMFRELEVHTGIEETVFYPAVRGLTDEVDDTVDEGLQEHHVVDLLMAEIKALDPADDAWKAKVTVLIENVEHHADEEEDELFPAVRGRLSADRLATLAGELETAKRRLGAPTARDNADRTVADLRRQATAEQIPGRSSMTREDLEATVTPLNS